MEEKKESPPCLCPCPPGGMHLLGCAISKIPVAKDNTPEVFNIFYLVFKLLLQRVPVSKRNVRFEIALTLILSFKPNGEMHGLIKSECPSDWLTRDMIMFFYNKLMSIKVRYVTTKHERIDKDSYHIKPVRRLTTFHWDSDFSPPTSTSELKSRLKVELDPQKIVELLIKKILTL